MNTEYKDILVYQHFEGERGMIDLCGLEFDNDRLYVTLEFGSNLSPKNIIGEASIQVSEDKQSLIADIIIYVHLILIGDQPAEDKEFYRPISKEQSDLLTPCIAIKVIDRGGKGSDLITRSKLTEISLCAHGNADPLILTLGRQIKNNPFNQS